MRRWLALATSLCLTIAAGTGIAWLMLEGPARRCAQGAMRLLDPTCEATLSVRHYGPWACLCFAVSALLFGYAALYGRHEPDD